MRFLRRFLQPAGRVSYAQSGEDLIADRILSAMGVEHPSYLDVGAHDPVFLSNTYFFYRKGCRGVCVDADPLLAARLRKVRPRDVCVNAGVAAEPQESAPFYVMEPSTLNTFSRAEAERCTGYGHKIARVIDVPLLTLEAIVERHCPRPPQFVSLDVEGMDLRILESIDFTRLRPEVFCVETLTYTADKTERKLTEIHDVMRAAGYFAYADTYINTVFVDEAAWRRR